MQGVSWLPEAILSQKYLPNIVSFSRVMELGAFEVEHIHDSFCMHTEG
jgi:hypothetical protein